MDKQAVRDDIIARAVAESGLPEARITGEVGRTTGQLRLFAGVLREGSWNGARPHSSGVTRDTFIDRIDDIAANIGRLQRGEPLQNVIGF